MANHPESEPKPAANYVFIDFENVHEVDLSLIGSKTVHVTLLLGAKQTRLDADLVEKLIEHASSVQLVRLSSSGKNALDFAVAYYLGKAVNADPAAYFHIVSKDTGFDPLIEHLRSRSVRARRHPDYTTLTLTASSKVASSKLPPKVPEDLLTRVIAHLQKNANNRPKKKKTLVSHLTAFSGKSTNGPGVDELIESLTKAGLLRIGDKEAVTYNLDPK